MSQKLNQNLYRREIDGIRGFAVIAVIINHFNKDFLPSGFLGVDIFFVISGFVISLSLSKRTYKNFKDFALNFYLRRICRILPTLIIFVFITGLIITFIDQTPITSLRTGIASLFGLGNIYLFSDSTNYFSESANLNPFLHTWSLGVEEQFYFVFPFLFWLIISQKKKFKKLFPKFLITFLTFVSFFVFIITYFKNYNAVYYLMPFRFWEIASGSLIFIFFKNNYNFSGLIFKVSNYLIPAFLVLILFLPENQFLFGSFAAVFLTSILIICLNKKNSFLFKIFDNKILRYLGKISYSLYIWHWPVISISKFTIGVTWWTIPIQISIIFLISIFNFRYIENKLRDKANSYEIKKISLLTLIALFGGFLSTLFLNFEKIHNRFYLGDKKDNYDFINQNHKIEKILSHSKCHISKDRKLNNIENLFYNCRKIPESGKYKKTIAFIGDSHTGALINSEKKIFDLNNRVIHFSATGCPFPRTNFGNSSAKCDFFLENTEKLILKELKFGDSIVITNYQLSYLSDISSNDVSNIFLNKNSAVELSMNKKRELYSNAIKRFSKEASKKGINIIFIGATPRYPLYEISKKEWFRPYVNERLFKKEKKLGQELNLFFKTEFQEINNLTFVDPFLEMSECCKNLEDYRKYFQDKDHYSIQGAHKLINIIIKKLNY
ncbi:MAG: acyltransferase [Prochlorococcus marinus CUG1435]|nr:acyltransferase [Prochlorococcus marinus CUG1435]